MFVYLEGLQGLVLAGEGQLTQHGEEEREGGTALGHLCQVNQLHLAATDLIYLIIGQKIVHFDHPLLGNSFFPQRTQTRRDKIWEEYNPEKCVIKASYPVYDAISSFKFNSTAQASQGYI